MAEYIKVNFALSLIFQSRLEWTYAKNLRSEKTVLALFLWSKVLFFVHFEHERAVFFVSS